MALRPRVSQNSLIESQSVPCHFRVGQNRSTRFLPRRGQAKKLGGGNGTDLIRADRIMLSLGNRPR